jgi:hypothetical protein
VTEINLDGENDNMLDTKGHFIVNKNRVWGSNIQYTVLTLKDRLIFMKTGGQFAEGGAASIAGDALGGILGGSIGSAIDSKVQKPVMERANEKLSQYIAMMEQQILRADKDNFVLRFEEVSNITFKKSGYNLASQSKRAGVLTIEILNGKLQKYDISKKSSFEETINLLKQIFPDKLHLQR